MKILVLSDSHSGRSFMRYCIQNVRPEHVIHLGDHYEDAEVMAQEYSHIRFHMVPGNCDRYRMVRQVADIMCYPIGGVKFLMTHGHKHGVKSDICRVIADARGQGAQAVLFGHTHSALCFQAEEDGLWVMNPGACGSWGGSVGLIEVSDGKIIACRILRQADIEVMQVPVKTE